MRKQVEQMESKIMLIPSGDASSREAELEERVEKCMVSHLPFVLAYPVLNLRLENFAMFDVQAKFADACPHKMHA